MIIIIYLEKNDRQVSSIVIKYCAIELRAFMCQIVPPTTNTNDTVAHLLLLNISRPKQNDKHQFSVFVFRSSTVLHTLKRNIHLALALAALSQCVANCHFDRTETERLTKDKRRNDLCPTLSCIIFNFVFFFPFHSVDVLRCLSFTVGCLTVFIIVIIINNHQPSSS